MTTLHSACEEHRGERIRGQVQGLVPAKPTLRIARRMASARRHQQPLRKLAPRRMKSWRREATRHWKKSGATPKPRTDRKRRLRRWRSCPVSVRDDRSLFIFGAGDLGLFDVSILSTFLFWRVQVSNLPSYSLPGRLVASLKKRPRRFPKLLCYFFFPSASNCLRNATRSLVFCSSFRPA